MRTALAADRHVQVNSLSAPTAFTMAHSAKGFRILFDNMYSDAILTIIGELSSNAYDSHAEAGYPERPIFWKLPNMWDLEFAVRDYGVGMSHDFVMQTYTSLFTSTKEDSNLSIGKFGLGSKTPFAYSDSFTLVCYDNGKARTYVAVIDPKGVPMITLMGETDTDEENGVRVAFVAKNEDIGKFRKAASKVWFGMPVKPDSTYDFEAEDKNVFTPTVGNESWTVYKDWPLADGAHIRQGIKTYPINISSLGGCSAIERAWLEMNVLFTVPIGACDVAASREALKYDPDTIANTRAAIAIANLEIKDYAQRVVEDAPSFWDANIAAKALKFGGVDSEITAQFDRNLTWRGKPVTGTFDVRDGGPNALFTTTTKRGGGWKGELEGGTQAIKGIVTPDTAFLIVDRPTEDRKRQVARITQIRRLRANAINDSNRHGCQRDIRQLRADYRAGQNGADTFRIAKSFGKRVFTFVDEETDINIAKARIHILFGKPESAKFARLMYMLGGPPVYSEADMPVPEPKERGARNYTPKERGTARTVHYLSKCGDIVSLVRGERPDIEKARYVVFANPKWDAIVYNRDGTDFKTNDYPHAAAVLRAVDPEFVKTPHVRVIRSVLQFEAAARKGAKVFGPAVKAAIEKAFDPDYAALDQVRTGIRHATDGALLKEIADWSAPVDLPEDHLLARLTRLAKDLFYPSDDCTNDVQNAIDRLSPEHASKRRDATKRAIAANPIPALVKELTDVYPRFESLVIADLWNFIPEYVTLVDKAAVYDATSETDIIAA